MDKREMLEAYCGQLALDYNAGAADFLSDEITVTEAALVPGRRAYTRDVPFFEMVTLGRGAVLMASKKLHESLRQWIQGKKGHWLFEHPNLLELERLMNDHGCTLLQSFHRYLPQGEIAPAPLPEGFRERWFRGEELREFYPNRAWPNALQEKENPARPDILALAAYREETVVGIAGASADTEALWQIGIDVLPEYRGKGLGTALVRRLAAQIQAMGKIPFYTTSLSNLHSQNIAYSCGFFPASVEISARLRREPDKAGKKLSEMTLEELWELFPIFLTEYRDCWEQWFREKRDELATLLPEGSRISHIGSTAIRGIWAKPIVDILIEAPDKAAFSAAKAALAEKGYLLMSEGENRASFNGGYTEHGFAEKVFHLHLRLMGDHDELYFRDYLNAHPEAAKEYEALKFRLWKEYEHDRDGYTRQKAEFVRKYTALGKE